MKDYLLGTIVCFGLTAFFWLFAVQFLRDAGAWVR